MENSERAAEGVSLDYYVEPNEILRGSRAYRTHEKRDSMYRVATFLVQHFWNKPAEMADALGVLLMTWNNAFYRYGMFDFEDLEHTLEDNMVQLNSVRKRDITSFCRSDEESLTALFNAFLDSLKVAEGKSTGRRSLVAVAKALHLLAPGFFPVWDVKISRKYGCNYTNNPSAAYLKFVGISKSMVQTLQGKLEAGNSTHLKILDEYNYAKYTKGWI